MMWRLLLVITLSSEAWTQSNYASQGNSIEYQPGLPPSTILDGKVTKLDELSPIIFLNRTKAYLNCSQGSMQVELKFDEPFYGVAYADFDRNSACMVKGRGFNYAELELPLKGCGTKQDPQRVFTNNIVVRFHPGLEMDGDEVITIICRYPPPITPKPSIAEGVLPPIPAEGGIAEPPLKGFQILLTICALLFLSLLLLGLGCSYLCLKRRNIRVVHRHPFGSATGSEITKLSGSSLGHLSMFEGLKIPRAHTLLHTAASSSGSEANLVIDHSDTLPSDYPSESHSEVGIETANAYGFDEIIHSTRSTTSLTPGLSQIDEVRSLPPSSLDSYDNKAYIHDQDRNIHTSSLYSETITDLDSRVTRHPVEPKFDVQMRVKRAPPPPSPLPSESDASIALERNLTTILEREEIMRSMETPKSRLTTFSYVPELHSPPSSMISRQQTPPVYSRILRKQAERESHEVNTQGQPGTLHRPRSLTTLEEYSETRTMVDTQVTDASHAKYRVASILAPTPPPPPPIVPTHTHTSIQQREHIREEVEPLVEPVVAPRRPEITTHEVDDVFLRTVTEKKTIEDVERHKRQVTEYYRKPDPKWDVTIRNYPADEVPPAPPQWENFSDVSSASNLTIVNDHLHMMRSTDEVDSTIEPTYSRAEMPSRSPQGLDTESVGDQWETLSRVLEPQYSGELTDDEREKWREVITTESTLRTLLSEAVVKEDYDLIRKDARYQTLFPPAKWDVIIRILSPPPASSIASSKSGQKYKRSKGSEWDSRSRRSSLPTLYEYDSDGGTSIRTHDVPGVPSEDRNRRLGITRMGSEVDLRSESETIRNFKMQRDDVSVSSYDADSIVRSLSQPSLARSEFAEHWGLPARNLRTWAPETEEIASSPDTTPMAIRRGDRVEVMTSFDSGNHPGLTSTFTRSTRYSERETVRVTEAGRPGWFHDDSEPEMQI
ncbi:zona pellucida domain protein papillote isoform X2 [Cotesia typhae]